jgi:hypothetical protein
LEHTPEVARDTPSNFRSTVSEQLTPGLAELLKLEDLTMILERFKAKLRRTPLIIFDQFDDYQTRHLSQFLPDNQHTWLSATELIKLNSFWRDIKNLIDKKAIHCLFVTRTDTADGLESIRFIEPKVYRLDRLNSEFVLPLLMELTDNAEDDSPVISAPHHGRRNG